MAAALSCWAWFLLLWLSAAAVLVWIVCVVQWLADIFLAAWDDSA